MPQQTITPQQARTVSRRWPLISAGAILALVAGLGALVAYRSGPYEFDAEWLEEIVEERNVFWDVPAFALNFLGGGWFGVLVVPIGVAVALLIARKRWSALYFVIASAASAGTVQLLKNLFGRARPEEILVTADFGSFPSGHVANAATLAALLAIILWRWWVVAAGSVYVVLMALSRTYLGAHWVSDTVGGLLIGAGVALIVWAPFANRMLSERQPTQ